MAGTSGANGGGIVFLAASTISNSGTISANGSAAGAVADNFTGGGGGGAGGSIYVLGKTINLGSAVTTATGGAGSSVAGNGRGGGGGSAGNGFVAINYLDTLNGTSSPTYVSLPSVNLYAKSALGTYGTLHIGKVDTVNADLAEYYSAADPSIEAGDVVSVGTDSVNNSKGVLYKSGTPYDSKLLGIISTDPGLVLGSKDEDGGSPDQRILALSGRVPVKIAPDSAEIHIGDYLTSSTTPGQATKATKAGYTIAKALENWSPDSGKNSIMAFINLGYYMGGMTADGYVDTGQNLIANNLNVKTEQGLIERILGIRESPSAEATEDRSASPEGQIASESASLNIAEALDRLVTRLETTENDISIINSKLLILNSATSSASLATIDDLVVTSGANIGNLVLAGNSLDAIGTLKLMGDTLEIDTNGNLNIKTGKIVGNSTFRDTATVPAGQTSVDIAKTWDTPPSTVTVTADYDTYAWVVNLTKDGFVIKVKNPPTSDQKLYWQAIW